MCRAYLIIQKVSFDHVSHVARFIHGTLRDSFGPDTNLIVCDQIDEADHVDNAIIFVIGEGFRPHTRRPGCTYVYLNFSIVAVMGNPLHMSKVGWSAIRRKRRMLIEKQAGFDVLLDYFGPQTLRLQRQMDMPVFGFGVAVDPGAINTSTPMSDRPFDVCFVGSMTPRRQKVMDALAALGLRVSPHSGVVYEDIAAQSRCCINIHAHRSNHLETPRIIGAMAAGIPVVTEPSYGLGELLPPDLVTTSRLGHLPETVRGLLNKPDMLVRNQQAVRNWYEKIYLNQCRTQWASICLKVSDLARKRPKPS